MTTETVSAEEIESARKLAARNEAEVLRAVARITQAHAAACMGVSASTISRTLEDLGRWSQLLSVLGLQVAPTGSMVVDSQDLLSLKRMALRYLEADLQQSTVQG
ncbi:CII family transcriptional regulator [Ralstonia insidiosa]|uniref:CII family transcriptional regulator n=1 Tax=Ralstonia insidiosa TaxID=190721 RepID=UPI000CEF5874|nr:CII family transcriptional regulator [Ralstonia insidiosa]